MIFITINSSSIVISAQEAAELKNAGNEALRNKDYKTALTKFEAYLASGEEGTATDKASIYNAGFCGYKLENIEKATKYLQKSIELKYKADYASYYIADLYKEKDEAKYLELLADGLKKYPTSKIKKYFMGGLTKHYNKLGSDPYNTGNQLYTQGAVSGDYATYILKVKEAKPLYEKAKEAFEKTLEYDPTNSTAKSAIAAMNSNLKTFDDYIASLKKDE